MEGNDSSLLQGRSNTGFTLNYRGKPLEMLSLTPVIIFRTGNNFVVCNANNFALMKFQVITVANMKMAIFWVFAAFIIRGTSVNFYQTEWRNNPEDSDVLFSIFVCQLSLLVLFHLPADVSKYSLTSHTSYVFFYTSFIS